MRNGNVVDFSLATSSMSADTDNVIRRIREAKRERDDVIYCNGSFKREILHAMNISVSLSKSGKDLISVSGLQVIVHDSFDVPVICKKGDYFPLAVDHN